jgi:hypothetical protein
MLITAFCAALVFPSGAHSQVTLTVGDGSGGPGACATPVEVILANPGVPVKGVSLDLCEANNTLIRLGCDTTSRTPAYTGGNADFSCVSNELENGCVRVLLFSNRGSLIDMGSGPVFALKYGVFQEAGPAGSCVELRAENVLVAGENGPLSNVGVVSGNFCYFECDGDADCADNLYCNGIETCIGGACQPGLNPCPDDGLFCTGAEGCDEAADTCTQGGNPCRVSCDETNNACLCSAGGDCDDGLYCNGAESCDGTFCVPGTNPCPSSSVCVEESDSCVECFNDGECDDGLFCNGAETCVAGSCQAAASPCPPLSTCDETNDVCACTDNAQCDDGLYCNGVERCSLNRCDISFSYFSDYPCRDCNPSLEDCDCNEANDACLPVTLAVGNGAGLPGTADNPVTVSVDTLFVEVNTIQIDICDAGNYLACTGCSSAGRTPDGFSCLTAERADGCCRITLIDLSGSTIEAGSGPVIAVDYTVSAGAPAGECRTLNVQNETVATSNVPLSVNATSGQFCFESGFAGASVSGSASGSSFLSAGSVAGVPAGDVTGSSGGASANVEDGVAGQDTSQTTVEDMETCPLVTAVDDQEQINTLRKFRDDVLSKTIFGQIFTYLFYRNATELTVILQENDTIRERIAFLVDEHISVIGEAASGSTACLTESDRKNVIDLLESVKTVGSPRLKADIELVIEGLVSGNVEEVFGITVEK